MNPGVAVMVAMRHLLSHRHLSQLAVRCMDSHANWRGLTSSATGPAAAAGRTTTVWSFGDNSQGALGHSSGLQDFQYEPETVSGLPTDIVSIAAGHYHSLAVTSSGQLWSWGRNQEGQLGPTREGLAEPHPVQGLEGVHIVAAAASAVVSMAISKDGDLWSWGTSKRGQLGLGEYVTETSVPQQIVPLRGVAQVALGWGHALACTVDGQLYCWGYADQGRLPLYSDTFRAAARKCRDNADSGNDITSLRKGEADAASHHLAAEVGMEKLYWTPQRSELFLGVDVATVACGMDHSLILSEAGDLYTLGDDSLGQLGKGRQVPASDTVRPVPGLQVLHAAAGLGHSLAIARQAPTGGVKSFTGLASTKTGQKVLSWGWNQALQLGRSSEQAEDTPGEIDGLEGVIVKSMSGGRVHSLAVTDSKELWTWGSGHGGRLGHGSSRDEPAPLPVEALMEYQVLGGACGLDHTLVLTQPK